ncbi:lysine--tRNA ligase [Candidatus Micrarchaeota archaeon]|nr:lysine--tRNA ligase [Candidatus Micrarchaeota archaeon]
MPEKPDETEVAHWADKFADEVITRKPDKKEYVVESGVTPSGVVHAGNFREIMTQDLVFKALKDKGVKARYQYFWDDYDRFRKVPAGVPNEWNDYIGLPVTKTPDPWKCHDSYADHFKSLVKNEMKALGINVTFKSAEEEYKKGTFTELVKKALEGAEKIREIHNKFRKDELEKDWLPVRVYCEKCGKDTTTAKYLGGYELEYACECGEKARIDFKKKPALVKMLWRVDWPARWANYDVDFESSGKEHQASGGSVDTADLVCRDVFNHEPPIEPMYEFIYFKGQTEKLSKSKGNAPTITDLMEVYEPEVIRYLYTPKINKSFDVTFDADLLNIYNYFDEAKKSYYGKSEKKDNAEARKYALSKLSDKYVDLPQFSVCVNVIQIALGDAKHAKEILKKTGHAFKDADERLRLAWAWVQKYAPEQYRFIVQEKMPDVKVKKEIADVLSLIADQLNENTDGDNLQQFIFNTSKEKGVPMKDVFAAAYLLFLNKERGPKLGPFLASLDAKFAANRLKMIE